MGVVRGGKIRKKKKKSDMGKRKRGREVVRRERTGKDNQREISINQYAEK